MSNETWKPWYRALKAANRRAYDKAIQYSEGNAIQFRLPVNQAAAFERSMVMLCCEVLGIEPDRDTPQ